MNKDLFATEAIAQIPKLLTLLDRNPHSPTYGCFDRNFWQYKIIDFPSGMSQEFVYPLALAYQTNIPNNPFYEQPIIKNWVEAGILYAAESAHSDSSCDDYFPFERAGGAAAFSLLAFLESYQLLNLDNQVIIDFCIKRADWLAHHQESGRLTNHQALIVLCLELLSKLIKTDRWNEQKKRRLEQVLSWQNTEGWFQEYEGCDPGYHTLTISCLARIYEFNPENTRLKDAIAKAVILASQFVHPDGSYGGEYTSRNTYNFFPHGFELVGKWLPEALTINDQFLKGLEKGLAPCYADDHIIGHHTWNYLLAWRDFVPERPEIKPRLTGRFRLEEGGIIIDRREDTELYLALNKGGVFKLFREGKLICSDTQFSLQIQEKNKIKNAVAHLVSKRYKIEIEDDKISIQGALGWAKQKQMTTLNLIILRVVMYSFGRFFPNLIRKLLQKILITGKKNAPFQFYRELLWEDGKWKVIDKISATSGNWDDIRSAGIGCDQTSIYVVMSRTFQRGQLQPWLDLTEQIKQLNINESLVLERDL
ncbi:hypothetical protein [Aphanothece sacrum]|uniref:Uncharacterized protein n=1 Tax=Aphanothece sacrum FPU1 TaxID=1920663 RepID=A0A401IGP6_APHSA|nr:hypothetical protein [Aphanothece sacrum]GBF80467.1 hypothetical protein AsFPU1_1868 [Aphanothece sacrum FPU1]GBF85548.1 hypothetical protein AsFPU3_2610 [Aphanothece sacrum FPU3]